MKKTTSLLILFFFSFPILKAQEFTAGIQIRPRFEYRNGFKTLLENEQEAAGFISQRSRLNLQYQEEKISVKLSMQNVRTWGDVPTVTTADKNGIAIFEAFGQYNIQPGIFVRLGRQVLAYDNQRILGGLDWAQQGQSHDALLFNLSSGGTHEFQLALGLNEDGEDLYEAPYLVNTYKNLQMALYRFAAKNSGISLLVLNTGYETETAADERKTQYLQTFGSYYSFISEKWSGDISLYGQTGKRNNQEIQGWYVGGNLNYMVTSAFTVGVGAEYISGTDSFEDMETSFSFTPLFGTNHGFNGFMDYFYVGNHFNSVGIQDYYGKFSFRLKNAELALVPHLFYTAAKLQEGINNLDPYLGTEIDVVGSHRISKSLTGSLGYSQMFGTNSLEFLKGGDADRIQNWAWVMISFHPEVFTVRKEGKEIIK
ncbi:alginate export family protein [Antarcticibacterium sp. 1MA-6-2]|uniref:alginate export family protein n=1 Tax=Antarcticibacterium sp. 1MA-6-2 TaxID=2908210 RepID=UPI001F472686|nr:alginate export family protein [Antarcticibacterium sp. 1MA-6-2]UJH92064.1 alginate export family protein [Antarcticibacterium sp. 1MA-6-2]